jgi:branched-chain amino acid transport system substrate-binding protein
MTHGKIAWKRLLVAAVVLAVSGLAGCARRPTGPIRLGAVLPLTGPAAQYGKYAREGIELAVSEINESNGIRGRHLEVVFDDSKAEPKEAVTIANRLISVDRVPVILCLTTSETSAIAPICESKKTVLLTGTVAPDAADLGEYVFRNASNLATDAETVMRLCQDLKLRRLAVVGLNIDAHLWVENFVRRRLPEFGGQVVAVENGNRGDTDFRTQLTKVKAARPDALYVLGYAEIAYILKQARELGIAARIFGDPSMESPEVVQIARNAADGVIYTRAAFDPSSPTSNVRDFTSEYRRRYKREPEVFAAQFYDSIHILARVMAERGTMPNDIREGLLSIRNYPGVSGQTTFLPNGDVRKPVMVKTIRGGKFVTYEPPR